MANELQFYGDPSSDTGLTITAKVYDNTGTQTGSDVTCTEVGSLAIYRGDMPTASAGKYVVRFFESTTFKGQGVIYWDGSAEITLNTIDTVIAKASDINALNDITAGEVVTAMQSVADDFKADVTSINSDVTAIKNKTDNLPDDPAKESSVQTSIAVSV